MSEILKKCPFCAEEIQQEAIKCKHCQSSLVQNSDDLKKQTPNKPQWKPLWIFIGCFLGVMLVCLMTAPHPDKDKTTVSTQTEEKITEPTPTKDIAPTPQNTPETSDDLNITPAQFKTRFNEAFRKIHWNLQMHSVSTTSDSDQISQIFELNPNLAFTLYSSKKTGKVTSVLFIGQDNGTLKSGGDLILAIGVLIETVSPELSPEERGQLFEELSAPSGDTSNPTFDGSATRDDIQYKMSNSKELGIILTISKTGT